MMNEERWRRIDRAAVASGGRQEEREMQTDVGRGFFRVASDGWSQLVLEAIRMQKL